MGYPAKIQLIKREKSEQWYINVPAVIAKAMGFERGETFEWSIESTEKLVLRRRRMPLSAA